MIPGNASSESCANFSCRSSASIPGVVNHILHLFERTVMVYGTRDDVPACADRKEALKDYKGGTRFSNTRVAQQQITARIRLKMEKLALLILVTPVDWFHGQRVFLHHFTFMLLFS